MGDARTLVTANLARGAGNSRAWLAETLASRPAVVFGQELAGVEQVEALAAEHGYVVVWPGVTLDPHWQVVSWVVAAQELNPRTSTDQNLVDRLRVHGSYAAAATLDWPGLGELTAVSMHASPKPVEASDLATYPGPPLARDGGSDSRHAGRLFYSDLMLDALAGCSAGHVLAAGDLNEARAWDDCNQGHTWGKEFFARVDSAGLRDVTFGLWQEERRTRFHPTHPAYQLDVVLASGDVADRITKARVDEAWTADDMSSRSDHAPVWFTMRSH